MWARFRVAGQDRVAAEERASRAESFVETLQKELKSKSSLVDWLETQVLPWV